MKLQKMFVVILAIMEMDALYHKFINNFYDTVK